MIAYALTDPSTLNFNTLESDLERFAANADMIVYRDKSSSQYTQNAEQFLRISKRFPFQKILLHSDYLLAHRLGADGVHLNSTQFNEIKKAKSLGLFTVISTHTLSEIKKAEILGANLVTYSPIFRTPNKGEPKGIKILKEAIEAVSIPIIALGGIVSEEELILCKSVGVYGFASIRYFA